MFVVDTNILIYAADQDSSSHDRCYALLEEWRRQKSAWYVTWGIIYEFLRVSTHPKVFRKPWAAVQSWKFVEALLASPFLGILRHAEVAASVIAEIPSLSGNLMYDAHTAILMREHGIHKIYTHDMDFHRFSFIRPIDPIA